jgi:hypothetical protein
MTSDGSDNPYASEYPQNCKVDSDIKALIAHYYKQVDTQGKHVEYSKCWAEDGVLIVPTGKEVRGREGAIPQLRRRDTEVNFPKLLEMSTLVCGKGYQSACIVQRRSFHLGTTRTR